MRSVQEALEAIAQTVKPLDVRRLPLAECWGLVLAEDVDADLDSPPFDKSLMDGFAVRAADVATGRAELIQTEELTAGRVAERAVEAGQTIRIMTGAPIPRGADAVVQVEQSTISRVGSEIRVSLETTPVSPGRSILKAGASLKLGQRVLSAGRRLRAQELGSLAELGRSVVAVRPAPRVAILATGDELVDVSQTPGPGQIRNSNETMLVAQVRQAGGDTVPLGIARDTEEALREKIQQGLDCDMLLLSGGVSAGTLDLVPKVLQELGVREIFHKVRIKPGQPLWFGAREGCCVFGLPGNPVSSMVCCEIFARTALRRMQGDAEPEPAIIPAVLDMQFDHVGNRPTYHPARLEFTRYGPVVHIIPWVGSADLCATVAANAMAVFPAGDLNYIAGTTVDVIRW